MVFESKYFAPNSGTNLTNNSSLYQRYDWLKKGIMTLTGTAILAARVLLDAPEYSGDVIELLQKKSPGITAAQAQSAARELENAGYLAEYEESRIFADATLNDAGVRFAKSSKGQ